MEQTNPPSLRESAQNLVAHLRQNMAVMSQALFDRLLAVEKALTVTSTVEELHARATKAQKMLADAVERSEKLSAQLEWMTADRLAAHKTLASCLRPETQSGTLQGDAKRIAQALQVACAQLFRALPGTVPVLERDLPTVVDELLKLRGANRADAEASFRAQGRAEKAESELTQLREAIGLLTTLHPMLEVDVRDPVGMAQKIVEKISCERSNAELDHRAVFDIGRYLEGDEFGGCGSVGSTVMAARDVLPKIAKLRGELEKARADLAQSPGDTCWPAEDTKPLEEVYRKATGGLVDSAIKAVQAKVDIVRDPATGWTFDKFRRELEVARTTAKGNAGLFAQALRELEAAKGGA